MHGWRLSVSWEKIEQTIKDRPLSAVCIDGLGEDGGMPRK